MPALLFAALAGFIHLFFFTMESLVWGSDFANKVFKVTPEQVIQGKVWAFNQGFYNLFLAIAVLLGVSCAISRGASVFSDTLIVYACLSMVGAGIVLLISSPGAIAGAVLQAGPPAIALALWCLAYSQRVAS